MKYNALTCIAAFLLAGCAHGTQSVVSSNPVQPNRVVHGEPETRGIWTQLASMPIEREFFAAGVINGNIYTVGGLDHQGHLLNNLEMYDPVSNAWSELAPMPTPRLGLGVGVINGVLYAVGGESFSGVFDTVEAYDPASNSWSTKAPLPTAVGGLEVCVYNGRLYAFGGRTAIQGPFEVNNVESYDPASNAWTNNASMPAANDYFVVGLIHTTIYAVGNLDPMVEAYHPATDTWTPQGSSIPITREWMASGVIGNRLYTSGGIDNFGKVRRVNEFFNPTTNRWGSGAHLPMARDSSASAVVGSNLYVIGGSQGGRALSTVYSFTP